MYPTRQEQNKHLQPIMKRQRTTDQEFHVPGLQFDHFVKFLQNDNTMTCDQLVILSKEIDQLYSVQANSVVQHLPSDVLLQIFAKAQQHSTPGLSWRLVSKAWHSAFSKLDLSNSCSFIDVQGNPTRLLSLFKFSKIRMGCEGRLDIALLKDAQVLFLQKNTLSTEGYSQLFQLTQLTDLGILDGLKLPQDSLLCLTNLQTLTLHNSPQIHCISSLTNLSSLVLNFQYSLTQEHTRMLTKLTHLSAPDPTFFRSGKGTCRTTDYPGLYTGEWLDGRREGKGIIKYDDKEVYEGEWHLNARHGQGKYQYWKPRLLPGHVSSYDGQWKTNCQHGVGTRIYSNKDTYSGQWDDGQKSGHGVYKFHDGAVYDGEFDNGDIMGQGKCVYANGDTYEGAWKDGERCGQGVYVFEHGAKIDAEWQDNCPIDQEVDGPLCGRLEICDSNTAWETDSSQED